MRAIRRNKTRKSTFLSINFPLAVGVLFVVSTASIQAQNNGKVSIQPVQTQEEQTMFFPVKEGTVTVYAQKDEKGKIISYSRQTIKNVEGSGKNMTINYLFENLDKDKKILTETPCKMIIKNNVMILDMKQFFAGQLKDQQIEVEITGIPMELPTNMQPGQVLKDAEISMSMNMGFTKLKTDVKMTEGKCLAIENVTVAAGTFKCHKITQTITTTVMNRNIQAQVVSWYAPNIGVVKTETYDDKGKLQSLTELVEIK